MKNFTVIFNWRLPVVGRCVDLFRERSLVELRFVDHFVDFFFHVVAMAVN